MTNYNDGKWHGWHGGGCPVHPKSKVQVRLLNPGAEYGGMTEYARLWFWGCGDPTQIIAFRVVKEYKEPVEPREWLIVDGHLDAFDIDEHAIHRLRSDGYTVVRVREVLE